MRLGSSLAVVERRFPNRGWENKSTRRIEKLSRTKYVLQRLRQIGCRPSPSLTKSPRLPRPRGWSRSQMSSVSNPLPIQPQQPSLQSIISHGTLYKHGPKTPLKTEYFHPNSPTPTPLTGLARDRAPTGTWFPFPGGSILARCNIRTSPGP